MRLEGVCIPVAAAWSSPFVRWQGPAAEVSSLDLAVQVTRRALETGGIEWPFREVVLGLTIPQKESFFGGPTRGRSLRAAAPPRRDDRPGVRHLGRLPPRGGREPAAARRGRGPRRHDRPHEQLALTSSTPAPARRAARPTASTGCSTTSSATRSPASSMLETAERVAAEAGIGKAELDALAARRYEQYTDALADDRAFQRPWMIPISVGTRREPVELAEDWGVRPVLLDEIAALAPVREGGVVGYATQTHPADGTAGMVVTSRRRRARSGSTGRSRTCAPRASRGSSRRRCRRRPSRRRVAALADAGIAVADVHVDQDPQPVRGQRRLARPRARRRRRRGQPVRLEPRLRPPAGADRRPRRSSS